MTKNIVICCDGTSNQFSDNLTNVARLKFALLYDRTRQVSYYQPGIGSSGSTRASTPWGQRLGDLIAQATGFGIEQNVQSAYTFISDNFVDGDDVFLFGFSRGAYTVRALAVCLKLFGVIHRGNEDVIAYAMRSLAAGRTDGTPGIPFGNFELFRDAFSHSQCEPRFVGIWDTVSSVSGAFPDPLQLPYVTSLPVVRAVRHAVAIDERRAFFKQQLVAETKASQRNIKQVWFAGSHGDVGGGYPEPESGPSKVTLEWMMQEAKAAGLIVDPDKEAQILGRVGGNFSRPDVRNKIHESMALHWHFAEFMPSRVHFLDAKGRWQASWQVNLFEKRRIPPGALVHSSVRDLGDSYCQRLPTDVQFVDTIES